MAQAVRPIRPARSMATVERLGGTAAALTVAVLVLGRIGLAIQQQAPSQQTTGG